MKILLVGSEPRTGAILHDVFRGQPFVVARCADIAGAVAKCKAASRPYDWIILEEQTAGREGEALSRSFPLLSSRGPVAVVGLAGGTLAGLSFVCAVRESSQGIKLLCCKLSRPGTVEWVECIHRGEGVIIEYQAPVTRVNGHRFAALKVRRPGLRTMGHQ